MDNLTKDLGYLTTGSDNNQIVPNCLSFLLPYYEKWNIFL
jgi:hypothetical protein